MALIPEPGLRLLAKLAIIAVLYAEGLRWWLHGRVLRRAARLAGVDPRTVRP